MRRRPTTFALLALAGLAAGATGCGEDAAPPQEPPPRYTSLMWMAAGRCGDGRCGLESWTRGDELRSVLVQASPGRLVLEDVPGGLDCQLRFGIAVEPAPGESPGDPAQLAVTLRGRHASGRIFREDVPPTGGWRDRTIALGPRTTGPFDLVFETTGPAGSRVGWSTPTVVCRPQEVRAAAKGETRAPRE